MKQFLIPTDFSESANNAIEFAVQSATIFPAEICILHAFEMNTNKQMDNMGVLKEFSQSLLDEAQDKLTELKKNIEGDLYFDIVVRRVLTPNSKLSSGESEA